MASKDDFEDMSNLDTAVEAAPKVRKVKKPAERVKIVLEENDDIPPTGLFVGVNGVSYLIRAGSEVEVPESVVDVLRNAVTSMPSVDPQTGQVLGYRDRMRYPFRIVP